MLSQLTNRYLSDHSDVISTSNRYLSDHNDVISSSTSNLVQDAQDDEVVMQDAQDDEVVSELMSSHKKTNTMANYEDMHEDIIGDNAAVLDPPHA